MKAKIERAISSNKLFCGCNFPEQALSLVKFKRGDKVFDNLNGASSAGIVISGKVEACSIAPDGSETILSTLCPGDCFGISNLFGGELKTRLTCLSRCEILFIPKSEILQKLSADSAFAERYMAFLNMKISFLINRVASLTAQSGRAKLADYLLSHRSEQNTVLLDRPKHLLAKGLGMSRAALFREFALLSKQGVISADKNRIVILKPNELSSFVISKSERN